MIYISKDRMKAESGRGYAYRVFADTKQELVEANRKLGYPLRTMRESGLPNEHMICSSTEKGKLSKDGAEEISQKQLVKLIRMKRTGQIPNLFGEPPAEPEPKKTGRVRITTQEDEDEGADE